MKALLSFLERLGVDCTATSNKDDAFAFLATIGILGALGLYYVSPWWSGFAVAAIIFNGFHWISARRRRIG